MIKRRNLIAALALVLFTGLLAAPDARSEMIEVDSLEAYLVRYESIDELTLQAEFLSPSRESEMMSLASQFGNPANTDFAREHLFPRVSVKLGVPQVVSAGIGVMIGSRVCRPESHNTHTCSFEGVLIEAEPGLGGGKASIGIGSHWVLYSWAAKFGILHTWGVGPLQNAQTYVGGEVDFSALFLRLSAGLFQRLGAGPVDQAQVFAFSGGIGF